jgi:hypothetical protein
MSAIDAYFVSFSTSRDGSTLRLVFELPTERTADVMRVLGAPSKDGENWCAVAKLRKIESPSAAAPAADVPAPRPAGVRESRTFTLSQRAFMLCKDKGFWKYIDTQNPDFHVSKEQHAADWMRWRLEIPSRSEIDTNAEVADMYLALEAEFNVWSGRTPRSAHG